MSLQPYPDYKDSGVAWLGDVPKHWQIARLKNSVESARNGVWGTDPDGTNLDLRCVRVADFDRQRLAVHDDNVTLRRISPDEGVGRILEKGDLLLEKSGGGEKSPVGFVVIYDRDAPAVCSNFVARIVVRRGFDSRFWNYVHSSNYSRRLTQRSIKQATGIQNLDQSSYLNELAVFPSIAEQHAIADFLDLETAEINAFIADQERLIELLTERRSATVSQAVIRGLDPSVPLRDSGVPWLGRIPRHWRLQRIWTMYSREKNVGFPDEQMLSVFRDYGVIPKSSRDNLNKTAENRNIYQLIEPGWLVANRMKAWQGSVGISPHRGIISGHYICFRPNHQENNAFLNMLFRSLPYTAGYQTISRGVRIGQAEIDNDEYRLLPVVLPPLMEQRSIVSHVNHETSEIDAAISDARQAIDLSRERRCALISAAVTGKIDLRPDRRIE